MDKAKSLTLKCKKETSSCQTFKAKRLVEQGASLSSELGEAQGEVTAENRFLFEMQDKTLELFEQGKVPGNTVKNTEWAYRNFESWWKANNDKILVPKEKCPDNILISTDKSSLCNCCASL